MNPILSFSHSGTTNPAVSEREKAHGSLARQIAAEGMVLLKNEGLLPLKKVPVTLLGSGAVKTVKGGIGSGDVNNRWTVSIYEGLQNAGIPIVSRAWLEEYEACYDVARENWKQQVLEKARTVENCFDAYSANPFVLPEGRPVTREDVAGAKAAIFVISRISGEGKDRRLAAGDYYLSQREQETLRLLNSCKVPTVVILNAGGVIELTDILEECSMIQAVLNISQPGQEAGDAVADVLFGKASPGGRLTATWPKRYEDIPYSDSFSYLNGDLSMEYYREGIFVGYRYFDSFGVEPLFPFGHGLSYTTFETELADVTIEDGKVSLGVRVMNTGSLSGREVVEIYVSLPQSGIPKEARRLVGFAKTKSLAPGGEETVTVSFDSKAIASFHSLKSCWMVQQGSYGIWVSRSIEDGVLAAVLEVAQDTVIEETTPCFPLPEPMEELDAPEKIRQQEQAWLSDAKTRGVPVYAFVPAKVVRAFAPRHYAENQPLEKLIPLLYGNITEGASTLGFAGIRVPGSAGETSEALEAEYGVKSLIMADGPAGLRLRQSYEVDRETDRVYGVGVFGSLENGFLEPMTYHENADLYYQYCTAFPVGTALAQTWDVDLMVEFGKAIAVEMQEFHVDMWLAPGMNIQRNPLCGRNFEYFSEDPLLAGAAAAAVTMGVQSRKGCGVTIKHFSGNNQEDNRMGVDCQISRRALREIYLRNFEIAVKSSSPKAIMTSYNLINGVHSANRKDLCTTVAREEWGFDGILMTDWYTTVPEDGSTPWMCADAGNDIIMPGNPQDAANIRQAVKEGLLSEEAVRACAGRIIDLAADFS
ncbi:MAG: glycoside hydrolase family 3 protein [Faecousia sp.]